MKHVKFLVMIKKTDDIKSLGKQYYDNANIFFQPEYAAFIQSTGKHTIYCYSEKYIIPIVITKRAFFRYGQLMSEPFCYDESAKEDMTIFLDELLLFIEKELKLHWLLPTPASAFFENCPHYVKKIPFGSHVINLSLDEDLLWKKVHSKHRNVIKKAERDGVSIACGSSSKLLEDYHSMDIETWHRSSKTASEISFYHAMIEKMKDNTTIYIAYLNGIPQSGAIFFFNKQMCYYMFGANKNNPHTGSGNLLQWHAILDMKAKGVRKYSFVGCRINEDENSKYHGIQRFKERFGGELVQGYMFKIVYSKWAYTLFDIIVGSSSFLHSGHFRRINDIIDQEYHKWS